ncbi:MAG: hypothetical protein KAG12_09825 [Desulfuromusa sp.]|nr:hypothetical protein [Desulfuromusa sp.]
MNSKCYFLSIVMTTAIVFMGMKFPVFAAEAVAEKESNTLIVCPEPRPQMCTMDFRPVCAELKDGSFETFSNGCMSCSDSEVVGYRDGKCEEGK